MKNIDELLNKWYEGMKKFKEIMHRTDLTEKEENALLRDSSVISTYEVDSLYNDLVGIYDVKLNGMWQEMKSDLSLINVVFNSPHLSHRKKLWSITHDFASFYKEVKNEFGDKYDEATLKIFYDITNLFNAVVCNPVSDIFLEYVHDSKEI